MKKLIKLGIVLGFLLGMAFPVQAIPILQLDNLGGSYDSASEPIIALGTDNTLSGSYYISAAVVHQQERNFSDGLIPASGTGMYDITPIYLYDSKFQNKGGRDLVNLPPVRHGGDRSPISVPEPGTLLLLGTGLILVAGIGRKIFKPKS